MKKREEIDQHERIERFRFSSSSSSSSFFFFLFYLQDRIPQCPERIQAVSQPYRIKKKRVDVHVAASRLHPASHTSPT